MLRTNVIDKNEHAIIIKEIMKFWVLISRENESLVSISKLARIMRTTITINIKRIWRSEI